MAWCRCGLWRLTVEWTVHVGGGGKIEGCREEALRNRPLNFEVREICADRDQREPLPSAFGLYEPNTSQLPVAAEGPALFILRSHQKESNFFFRGIYPAYSRRNSK